MYSQKTYLHLEVAMHIARWGNSLAVRIPAKTVKALALKEGDEVELDLKLVESGKLPSELDERAAALERLRGLRGSLTQSDLSYNRDELYER
jgi:antitoxin MazE